MSCKIFISHASTDKVYANLLLDFLSVGLGINNDDIFCSSVAGSDIPIGVDFNDYIITKIKESSDFYTIAIISNSYYNSRYCIYELGAAWGLGKDNSNIIPFLVEDMDRGSPKDFIRYKQNVVGSEESEINKLSLMLRDAGSIQKKSVPIEIFERERAKLISGVINTNEERKKAAATQQQTEGRHQKIKVVAFDFDGTILQGKNYKHSWMTVWTFLNLENAKREALLQKHREDPKNYSFKDWCEECVGLFIKEGFKKEHITKIIQAGDLKLAMNFEEVIRVLNALGIKIIIISGGIDTFVQQTIDENLLEFIDEIFINKFHYNSLGILDGVTPYLSNESDGMGKVKVLENYCIKNKISLSEVAFIGDRINDMEVLQSVGKPIVYPANKSHPHLRAKSLKFNMVHEESMVHILPFIIE